MSGAGYDVVVDVDDEGDLAHTDLDNNLEFQNYHSNDTPQGKVTSGNQNRGGFFSSGSGSGSNSNPRSNENQGKRYLWTMSFYAQFFDVDSDDVLKRCWAALFPRANFLDVMEGNADLYGPVWISTTVVLFLFLTTELASYFTMQKDELFVYTFGSLTAAAGLVYGYTALVPIALWGVLKWFGSDSANLLECMSLYGYANVIWVPVSIASISPISILNWVFVAIGLGVSGFFLFRNLFPVVNSIDNKTSKILLIVMIVLHAGFALAIKILFFAHSINEIKKGKEPEKAPEKTPEKPAMF